LLNYRIYKLLHSHTISIQEILGAMQQRFISGLS
jgi:hypothetical protein